MLTNRLGDSKTNGPEPSKTIESNGSKIKNHWKTIGGNGQTAKKTFNGDGLLKNHWQFAMVSSKLLKFTMVSKKPNELDKGPFKKQYTLKRMELSFGHNYNLDLALL